VSGVSGLHGSGEIALANGSSPLVQPTEVAAAGAPADTIAAANALKAITLDDGATTNFAPNNPNPSSQGTALPWLTGSPVRVGASVTWHSPVILDFRSSSWRFQPTQRLTGDGSAIATFANTRSANAAPQDVGGTVALATFNLQGFFATTGEAFESAAGGDVCTEAVDRDGNPVTVTSCTPQGPAGAATGASLARQQSKLVAAINGLDASVVGLQELENSAKLDGDRDDALDSLVAALNGAAGAGTWAAVPSPDVADRPDVADESMVRNALIYRPADLALVGGSEVLVDETNFDNAIEPLAQTFKAVGAPDEDGFVVVVNQFAERTASEADRSGQAAAAADFASAFTTAHGVDPTFLVGDLNSYSMEAPVTGLAGDGYAVIPSDTAGEATFATAGLSGSLDHVLGNAAAVARVTGADVWDINAAESAAYHYSRHNGNVTQLVDEASVFGSSDHNPVLVGLDLTDAPLVLGTTVAVTAAPVKIRAGSGKAMLSVDVTSTGGNPVGTVRAIVGSSTSAPKTVSNGSALLPIGPFATVGSRAVKVVFTGASGYADSQDTTTVQVIKAVPTMRTTRTPGKVVMKKTRARIAVVVAATGLRPTGKVVAKLGAKSLATGQVSSGKTTLRLPKFKRKGTYRITVTYVGNSALEKVTKQLVIKVKKKK
jgi:predicted extracellular nuclease